jgi:hypothetical protein
LDVLPIANEFEIPITSEVAKHYSIPSSGEFDFTTPPTPTDKPRCAWWCPTKSSMKMLRLLTDIGNTTTLAAAATIEGAVGFMMSLLYLAIFNLLAEAASSLQVLDMPLVEINDEDMRVLFNLATRCHTSHLRVHVYLAIFNLLAETASSL